jgi:hypothetical protein
MWFKLDSKITCFREANWFKFWILETVSLTYKCQFYRMSWKDNIHLICRQSRHLQSRLTRSKLAIQLNNGYYSSINSIVAVYRNTKVRLINSQLWNFRKFNRFSLNWRNSIKGICKGSKSFRFIELRHRLGSIGVRNTKSMQKEFKKNTKESWIMLENVRRCWKKTLLRETKHWSRRQELYKRIWNRK